MIGGMSILRQIMPFRCNDDLHLVRYVRSSTHTFIDWLLTASYFEQDTDRILTKSEQIPNRAEQSSTEFNAGDLQKPRIG